MDSNRQVWEPGLDQGSTQTLHSERHGPRSQRTIWQMLPLPPQGAAILAQDGARGACGAEGGCSGPAWVLLQPCPPFPGAHQERMGPAGHRAMWTPPSPHPAGA